MRGRIAAPSEDELAACPFCEGREALTPPETLALGREDGEADTPGWRVRVVPNLYPALERQEVVVHSPRHALSVGELSAEELHLVAEAWRARAAAARAEGFAYVHALVNEGGAAGASRSHTHSQLVWLRERPPAVAAEGAAASSGCPVCQLVAAEVDDGARVVDESGGLVALAAYAGRLPYELLLAPFGHPTAGAFDSSLLPAAVGLLGRMVARLHAVEGPVPLNAWLHDGDHWHLEVVPRLTVLAGLELGAGIYVNALAPEEAARRLREAG